MLRMGLRAFMIFYVRMRTITALRSYNDTLVLINTSACSHLRTVSHIIRMNDIPSRVKLGLFK